MAETPPGLTLGAALARASASDRGVRFVAADESSVFVPYSRLHPQALELAGGLRALGLSPGDRVGIVLPTCPAFLDVFFAATLAGLVPVPLYPPVRLGRLGEYHAEAAVMLLRCGARLVVTSRRLRPLLGPALRAARPQLGCAAPEELPRRAAGAGGAEARADPDDIAFIQYSSGTTAAPKPIGLSHRAALANAAAIQGAILAAWPEGPELVHAGASWLPLYHDMGLVGCVFTSLLHPADLTLLPPEAFVARPALWLRTISRWRATVSPAPNFAFALCADRVRDEELEGVDLSCWRVAPNGAEPVTPSVLRRFVDRFAPFGLRPTSLTPVYGLGEAALAVTFSDPRAGFVTERFERRALAEEGIARPDAEGVELASVGRPLPGFDLRIADDSGAEVRTGRVGRVLVRGPSLMSGYVGLPEETAAVVRDGWLDTGDLGFLHRGELYLHGRRKELVVVRGRKHAPQLIEAAVEGLEGARKGGVAALGVVPEEGDGEELVVLLERARGWRGEASALAEAAAGRIALHTGLVAARVEILEPGTLPRTSSGKIRRAEARRRLLAGTLRPPAPAGPLGVLRQLAASSLRVALAARRRA